MSRQEIIESLNRSYEEVGGRIAHDIEANRKATAHLICTDRNGTPVEDVKITLKQKSHAFRFGANCFMLDELETPEKNATYKERFKSLFNMATLPFYWRDTEPSDGAFRFDKNSPRIYRRPPTDRCMEFCRENGIEPREHGLAYASNSFTVPEWMHGKSKEETKEILERRFRAISERYADQIRTIEVTNEAGRFFSHMDFYFDEEYMPFCYRLAEKYFPKNQIGINEDSPTVWNNRAGKWSQYYMTIEKLLKMGCRIDTVGMQYHMFYRREEEKKRTEHFYDLSHLLWTLDTYATLGKPIQITEVTIPAYSWEAEDEAVQAAILEKLYPLWFSHPAVEQIIYWNLADGYAYKAEPGDMTAGENYYHGGLLRFDMSKKPAYEAIEHLLKETWHSEASLSTDNAGNASFRGFCGEYEYTAEKNGRVVRGTLTVGKCGIPAKIVF